MRTSCSFACRAWGSFNYFADFWCLSCSGDTGDYVHTVRRHVEIDICRSWCNRFYSACNGVRAAGSKHHQSAIAAADWCARRRLSTTFTRTSPTAGSCATGSAASGRVLPSTSSTIRLPITRRASRASVPRSLAPRSASRSISPSRSRRRRHLAARRRPEPRRTLVAVRAPASVLRAAYQPTGPNSTTLHELAQFQRERLSALRSEAVSSAAWESSASWAASSAE